MGPVPSVRFAPMLESNTSLISGTAKWRSLLPPQICGTLPGIFRRVVRWIQPEKGVGTVDRAFHDCRIGMLTSNNMCASTSEIFHFGRVAHDYRNLGAAIE